MPPNHLVHVILDAVDKLDLRQCRLNTRGTGDWQDPPSMLLALLVYSYATGVFGSRRIEQSTYDNIAVRLLIADTHPDHDTICAFRREKGVVPRKCPSNGHGCASPTTCDGCIRFTLATKPAAVG